MKASTIILFLLISFSGVSQTNTEYNLLHEHCCGATHQIKLEESEMSSFFLARFAFNIYKKFISSQDHMSCVFTPTCSEYALEAVQKQGFLAGIINTFDRLTRCNGLRAKDYEIDPQAHLLKDPVRNSSYEEL
jgi:putative membrane protein insertion efficiency factor